MKYYYYVFIFLITSCSISDTKPVLPTYTGAINEAVIVMDDHYWDQLPGDSIRKYLSTPVMGISWTEPSLNLIQISQKAFSRIFRTHRNLLLIEKGEVSKFVSGTNLYSQGQYFSKIIFKSNEDLLAMLSEYLPVVLYDIKNKEKKRLKSKMYFNKSFDPVFRKHGYSLDIPKEFTLAYDQTNFSWFEYSPKDKELISGVLMYQLPFSAWPSSASLLKHRNDTLKKYVTGEQEGSYMALETAYQPYIRYLDDDLQSLQIKSLWKMENAFMGGASISNYVADSAKQSVMVFETFLFNPGSNKRNDLQYLEVILDSAKKKNLN